MPQPQNQQVHRKEFDILVQKRDKFGEVVETNDYAFHVIEGRSFFERPIGSGNLFQPNGEASGRLTDRVRLTVDDAAAHVKYVAPASGYEQAEAELIAARKESEELRKELDALRAESRKNELAAKIADLEQAVERAPQAQSRFAAHLKED